MTTSKVNKKKKSFLIIPVNIINRYLQFMIWMAVTDGLNVKAACGGTPPETVTSCSNSLRIVFKTDSSRNATGFTGSWSAF